MSGKERRSAPGKRSAIPGITLFKIPDDKSRGEVDALVKKALETGGKAAMPPIDMGFMYSGSFYDPDGHHWEVLFMEPQALQG